MAATPFVAIVTVIYQDGFKEAIPMTCSDVTTALWVAPDLGTNLEISGAHGNAQISDINLSAGGVDTRTSTIRINSKSSPTIVMHGGNVGTTFNRQFTQVPLELPAGARVTFTQVT